MMVHTRVSIAVLAVLGIAAAAALAVSAGAGAPAHGASKRQPRVYVANKDCRGHEFRPARITLACGDGNLYVSEVHYFNGPSEGYGSEHAGASVTIHENDCKLDCAAGKFIVEKERSRSNVSFAAPTGCSITRARCTRFPAARTKSTSNRSSAARRYTMHTPPPWEALPICLQNHQRPRRASAN
jgi:hypothetical protein